MGKTNGKHMASIRHKKTSDFMPGLELKMLRRFDSRTVVASSFLTPRFQIENQVRFLRIIIAGVIS